MKSNKKFITYYFPIVFLSIFIITIITLLIIVKNNHTNQNKQISTLSAAKIISLIPQPNDKYIINKSYYQIEDKNSSKIDAISSPKPNQIDIIEPEINFPINESSFSSQSYVYIIEQEQNSNVYNNVQSINISSMSNANKTTTQIKLNQNLNY